MRAYKKEWSNMAMAEYLLGVFRTVIIKFWEYNGNGLHIGLFFAAVLYLLAFQRDEDKEAKVLFFDYSILLAILCFCPISAHIIIKYCIGAEVYWRMFWLLPMFFCIAYVLVRWLFAVEGRMRFAIFFVAAAAVIMLSGQRVYTTANFQKAENAYKLPQSVIEVCDFVREDYRKASGTDSGTDSGTVSGADSGTDSAENSSKDSGTVSDQDHGADAQPKITVPNDLLCYIRQYDAGIRMPYGRNALKGQKMGKAKTAIFQMMTSGEVDWARMAELLKEEHSDYFIYPQDAMVGEELEENGYHFVGVAGEYSVFRCDGWE